MTDESYMVWLNENMLVECASNPRCIRPEDYTPSEVDEYRHDLHSIPEHELGTIPLFRLFCITYVIPLHGSADASGARGRVIRPDPGYISLKTGISPSKTGTRYGRIIH